MSDRPLSDKQQTLRAAPLRIGISTRALFNLDVSTTLTTHWCVNGYQSKSDTSDRQSVAIYNARSSTPLLDLHQRRSNLRRGYGG